MPRFQKMTRQQRELYAALRALREIVLSPQDARPARALKRRGLVVYRRRDGIRTIALKQTRSERVEKQRLNRWNKWDFWPGQDKGSHESKPDRAVRRRDL